MGFNKQYLSTKNLRAHTHMFFQRQLIYFSGASSWQYRMKHTCHGNVQLLPILALSHQVKRQSLLACCGYAILLGNLYLVFLQVKYAG